MPPLPPRASSSIPYQHHLAPIVAIPPAIMPLDGEQIPEDPAAEDNAGANAAARRGAADVLGVGLNRERGASSIPLADFVSGTDDFETWIERFENAVQLATNATSDARRKELYLQWLPLKLDDEARAILKQVPPNTSYADTITQMNNLLSDPVEEYKWKAMKSQIYWDGKESFQALATRIIRSVDKYEKQLNDAGKQWAYFFRFRAALPEKYQDHIDVSIPKNSRTIENAKELALRVQMTQRGKDTKVAFTGAALADDRIHTLEMEMAKLNTKIDNIGRNDDRDRRDDRPPGDRYDRRPSGDRYQNPRRYDRSSSGDRYYQRSGRYNRSSSGDRYDRRPGGSRYVHQRRRDSRSPSDYRQASNDRYYRNDRQPSDDRQSRDGRRDGSRDNRQPRGDDRPSRSGRDNSSNYRRNSPPPNVRSQPMSDTRFQNSRSSNRNDSGRSGASRDNSNSQRNYRAIQTADEDSDFSDLDDDTLNAYIESLKTAKANREARKRNRQEN